MADLSRRLSQEVGERSAKPYSLLAEYRSFTRSSQSTGGSVGAATVKQTNPLRKSSMFTINLLIYTQRAVSSADS